MIFSSNKTESSEEYEVQSSEAMIAATLSLMTGYAQAASKLQKHLISHKISANLDAMAMTLSASEPFQVLLYKLQAIWSRINTEFDEATPALQATDPAHFFHAPTGTVQ